MHPEIKAFWEKTGHKLHGPTLICSWEVHRRAPGPMPIYRIETVCHGDKYRFDGQWYSEEDMLRIVRLKAFI